MSLATKEKLSARFQFGQHDFRTLRATGTSVRARGQALLADRFGILSQESPTGVFEPTETFPAWVEALYEAGQSAKPGAKILQGILGGCVAYIRAEDWDGLDAILAGIDVARLHPQAIRTYAHRSESLVG